MKYFAFFILLFAFTSAYSQDEQIKAILLNVKRDSTDKKCKLMFDDFYNSFESDAGQANPLMITATLNLFNYKSDPNLANKQLAILLYQYINAVSEPEKALKWIDALKIEYKNVYGRSHPLILLYQGESLGNANRTNEAYIHFKTFLKEYPNSVVALVNLYGSEQNPTQKKVYFDKLKSQYPTNWAVKNLK